MSDNYSPLVSIITPTYNHEKFIGPCIESVLKQTYQNWEQIIIDDGSTDRTRDVVESYSDERIRYYRQKNRGIEALAHAYNTALQHARGVLVAILEGDDLWPPYKLSTQVPPFANADIVLNYGVVGEVSVDGVQRETLARSVRTRMRLAKAILFNDPVRSATRYMLRADGVDLVPPSTVVIRRSALQCIGGFQYVPGLYVTDYPTFLWLSLQGKFHYTQELVGYRRRHLGSATLQNLDLIISGAEAYAVQFASQQSPPFGRRRKAGASEDVATNSLLAVVYKRALGLACPPMGTSAVSLSERPRS